MQFFFPYFQLEGTTPLARLFNAYLEELQTHAVAIDPGLVTMHELHMGLFKSANGPVGQMTSLAEEYLSLSILQGSLKAIHKQVLGAVETLEQFFSQYAGNLTHYAVANRLASIERDGSNDDSDFVGLPDTQEGQVWAVAYKDDSESLAPYSLKADLRQFFGEEGTRGEFLGRSDAADFYPWTEAVAQASEFSTRNLFAHTGVEVPFSRLDADGNQQTLQLADHIEDEINQDIRNGTLVEHFNHALNLLSEAARRFHAMAESAEDSTPYRGILALLKEVRDLDFLE
ncbi:hypothetical protein [Hymenobacter negativus]|uniref:Uncharacterized protein n=1 Tax=Hymenobacter negativus TaxID=2795026 RepID=A0ABS3QMZ4_9BACT|nr:hypothetical protein [Hymenobacter negativus]MBO2012572.1 hypothetical protein [Hymenobacter negativus]